MQYMTYPGLHHAWLYFANKDDCAEMEEKMKAHYVDIFEDICTVDEFVANEVINTIVYNNTLENCSSGKTYVDDIRYKQRDEMLLVDWLLLISLLLFSYTFGKD
jgi:hypothetical protein